MTTIVTGAAGFIGYHVSLSLLSRGERVVGLDNLNNYYDVALKQARLSRLESTPSFQFEQLDISREVELASVFERYGPIHKVVHLAAQAGVRYSIENPMAYVQSNLVGQVVILEQCRRHEPFEHLVYASSSSVYGGNTKLPFSTDDPVNTPISLYAATKRADELMGYCYSHLYGIPATGLRFFTVYGPWGRPDMAAYLFAEAILAGRPIKLFNDGKMRRDFTYIDDIVSGVIAALDRPPGSSNCGGNCPPHKLYNLGNNNPEPLMKFVELLEMALDRKASIEMLPMQPGDVAETYADITAAQRDLSFAPKVAIEEGLPLFVSWFRDYHGR